MEPNTKSEWRLRVEEFLFGLWNRVAYRKPVHPREGIDYPMTPRWRRRA